MNVSFNLNNKIFIEKEERYMPISYNVIDFGNDGRVACIGCNAHKWEGPMGFFSLGESEETHYFLIKENDPRCNRIIRCIDEGEEWSEDEDEYGIDYYYIPIKGRINGNYRVIFIDEDLFYEMDQ